MAMGQPHFIIFANEKGGTGKSTTAVHTAVALAASGHRVGALDLDQKVTIRLAATSAIHRAREVAEECYREAGTTAIFAANPFERPCRDMHAAGQQVQARTAHLEVAGAHLLGLPVGTRFI